MRLFSSRVCFPVFSMAALLTSVLPVGANSDEPESILPLKKVVLFSSGVGYFEHRGEVEGTETVKLRFNVKDINDLLKSMVAQDLGNGQVTTVTYGSQDPISRTLKSFAIDLTALPTLAQLLIQIRGHKIQVDAPEPIVGLIVGVEYRQVAQGKDEILETEVLMLRTDSGLRLIPMHSIHQTKILDPEIDQEFQQALELLATARSADKKLVRFQFVGKGKRPVRIAFVQESPVWKTTYRLIMSDRGEPTLQGWALVENTTQQDWENASLTLVSGRPISFAMNLYEPMYVNRPWIAPELYASLRPRTYDQNLAILEEDSTLQPGVRIAQSQQRRNRGSSSGGAGYGGDMSGMGMDGGMGVGGMGGKVGGDMGGMAMGGGMPGMDMGMGMGMGMPGQQGGYGGAMGGMMSGMEGMTGETGMIDPFGASTDAQRLAQQVRAEEVGELFRYVIAEPINLPRQQSAMLPIVNGSVKGEKVAIYNPLVQRKHPLAGFKLINDTDLHLMQGPITVFDGGEYAGDAQIVDIPPGGQRLISYALDLDVEVSIETSESTQEVQSLKIAKGTFIAKSHIPRTIKYVVKNSGDNPRRVLVEQPIEAKWSLVAPEKPIEQTRDLYRFAIEALPNTPTTLTVVQHQAVAESLAIASVNLESLSVFLRAKAVSDNAKKAVQEIVRRRTQINQLSTSRTQAENTKIEIGKEQARIRQNIPAIDKNSELYRRYVKKFTDQETEMETLDTKIKSLNDSVIDLTNQLDSFAQGLTLE